MDRLTEMEAFIRVVEQGGFTEAAKKMGVSKSAVSKHVAGLEARLGARLLNRTTRRVAPTEIGLAYLDRAKDVIAQAEDADAMASSMQDEPRGELRISAPFSFGLRHIAPVITDFLNAYPEVSVLISFDDRHVEVMSDGFDLAIRVTGNLPDSSMIARKLAETPLVIVASPDYLAKRGEPQRIEDLSSHDLLHYSLQGSGQVWKLRSPSGEERSVRVGGRLTVDNGDGLLQAACDGLGIMMGPGFLLCDDIEAGRLRHIMPNFSPEPLGIYAIYPAGRFPQPKLRVFVDFLAERLAGLPDASCC